MSTQQSTHSDPDAPLTPIVPRPLEPRPLGKPEGSDDSRKAERASRLAREPVVDDVNTQSIADEVASMLEGYEASEALHTSLLCSLKTIRKQKPNPFIAPLHEDVKDGDIFTKAQLLNFTDDGFHEEDLINDPRKDPKVGDPKAQKDEHLLVEVHGSPELQKRIREVVSKYKEVLALPCRKNPQK